MHMAKGRVSRRKRVTEADAVGPNLAAFLEGRAAPELVRVVTALATAAIPIAALIRRGPLAASPLAAAVCLNPDGDAQKALDLFADKAFAQGLGGAGARGLASEERAAPAELDRHGRFLVTLDLLDGSSNIDVNVTIGSIFPCSMRPMPLASRRALSCSPAIASARLE
jgi:fructose-1,6-bisphosphatase